MAILTTPERLASPSGWLLMARYLQQVDYCPTLNSTIRIRKKSASFHLPAKMAFLGETLCQAWGSTQKAERKKERKKERKEERLPLWVWGCHDQRLAHLPPPLLAKRPPPAAPRFRSPAAPPRAAKPGLPCDRGGVLAKPSEGNRLSSSRPKSCVWVETKARNWPSCA